ncbi:MAG: sensor histidine kinase [Frankiales bacterium]|nr:sensor histidine kinase [Frankiales bacterium]
MRSLRQRLALGALLVAAVCLAVLTLAFDLLLAGQLRSGADDLLRSRAVGTAASFDVQPDGSLHERGTTAGRLVPGTWVYQGTTALQRAPGDEDDQRRADALAGVGERFAQSGEPEAVRFLALPLRLGRRQVGTVVSSVPLDPYRRVEELAYLGSAGFAVLVLGGAYVLSRAMVGRALSPVAEMTEQAARWSTNDVDRRFGTARRPVELQQLAATLDGVLDRLSAVLRHEQQLSAELSHELRTPLAAVVAEVELLDSRPRQPEELAAGHAAVLAAAARMSRVIESLLTAARASSSDAPGRCDLGSVVQAAVELLDPRVEVHLPAHPVSAGVDAALLERALAPLLENALRYRRSRVTVEVGDGDGEAPWVAVSDDGPGVPASLGDAVFEPGVRSDDGHGGAGLGLTLARRLARAGGGDLVLDHAAPGARLLLTLPPG